MRNGVLKACAGLLASAGLALAKPPGPVAQISFEEQEPTASSSGAAVTKPATLSLEIQEAAGPGYAAPVVGGGDGVCGPAGQFWFSAEYLLWWIRDSNLPPLVTTGPLSSLGILQEQGTSVLVGGQLDHAESSGGRFTGGMWIDDQHTLGLEAGYFFLGSRTDSISVHSSSTASGLLARPFFDVSEGVQSVELNGYPGLAAGNIHISSSSRLQGAEGNGICNLCCGCSGRVDLLGGFRWLQLDEGLTIGETVNPLVDLGDPFLAGNTIRVSDLFGTHNDFYGGQLGARSELRRGRLFVDVLGKVALGDTHQVVNVSGLTTVTTPAGVTSTLGNAGLLALGNRRYSRDEFSVVPEVGINLGYQVSDHLRAFVGYTFLYWSDVVRPGDQVSLNVNPAGIPTNTPFNPQARQPSFAFHDTDFWAQGINFGFEVRY